MIINSKNPEEFIKKYEVAIATQKWNNISPLIHENASVTFTEDTFHGKPNVKGAFEKTFKLIQDETYLVSNINWIKQNDKLAIFTFNYKWSGIINGQRAEGSGRGTSV
ncbi:MAG: nuclear transport factor 2 family protein [Candidatus Marinimicrobia bacterium]|nr:nuclear transport factor 2 family protein [Candidatus Neomarinimicrobiota bacterium]